MIDWIIKRQISEIKENVKILRKQKKTLSENHNLLMHHQNREWAARVNAQEAQEQYLKILEKIARIKRK